MESKMNGKSFEGYGASSLWQRRIRAYGQQAAKNVDHREARSCLRRRNESNPAEGRPNFARKASIPIDASLMAILSFSRAFSRSSIRFFSFVVIDSRVSRCDRRASRMFFPVFSSVDFFPVANGEHNNDMDRIVNRVNDTIVSHAQAVFVGIAQFFCLVRSWVGLQFKQTVFQERLNEVGQRKEFFFRAAGNGNLVAGHSLCFLFASDRNFRKGLQGSSARSCAIARSVKSSRRRLSLIMLSTTWFLTACGNIRNAIINTCAVACWELG